MSEPARDLIMQLSVVKTEDGFEVDTHFADGYGEEALAEIFEMWAEEQLGDEPPSPGWGRP